MHTVGQLIRDRREKLGLTLAALAEQVGVTRSYLSMIENHRVANPPSEQLLRALEQALSITDGELVRSAHWQNTPTPVRDAFEQVAVAAEKGRALAEQLKQLTGKRRGGGRNLDELYRSGALTRMVNDTLRHHKRASHELDAHVPVRFELPLINRVAAGYPRDFTDMDYPARVADEYVSAPGIDDPQAFAARVVGESMLPEYREGDVIVFSPAAKVADGCDCFVRLEPDHETTFKRIYFDGDMIRLQPLNPKFAMKVVHRDDVAGLYRAVWRMQAL